MGRYRVIYASGNDVYLDVEANSQAEAEAIANKADGGDFKEVDGAYTWEHKNTLTIAK